MNVEIVQTPQGGIMPGGTATLNEELPARPTRECDGQDARLYNRRDARRCAEHMLYPNREG